MSAPRDRPPVDAAAAERLAARAWDLACSAIELEADVDRNFRLDTDDGRTFLLKVARKDQGVPLDLQQEAVRRSAAHALAPRLPEPVATSDGRLRVPVRGRGRKGVQAACLGWIDGVPLALFRPRTDGLVHRLGEALAAVDVAIRDLDHPALDRRSTWDLRHAVEVVDRRSGHVAPERQALLVRAMTRIQEASGAWKGLPVQPVHCDANDYNVLVSLDGSRPVLGLIDFGDMVRTWRVAEVAIAAAYASMDQPDPVATLAALTAGYDTVIPLEDVEFEAIPHLVALRLCASVVCSASRSAAEPDDPYLVVSQRPAWDLLERLDAIHPRLVEARVRAACGRSPSRRGERLERWLRSAACNPAFILDLGGAPRPLTFDFSVGGADLDFSIPLDDPIRWTQDVEQRLAMASANVGIGRYLEPRLCYTGGQFAAEDREPEFQRTVHLGVDLFAPAGTPVRAPFDAVVESVVDNARSLDYGPTVILRHAADGDRPVFRTLYGHLGREVLDSLHPGRSLAPGEAFATLGTPEENGGWPPHVHYQVVADATGRRDGDFPGVAWPSEADAWAALCPEPPLGLDPRLAEGGAVAVRYASPSDLYGRRAASIAPSLGLSYDVPLHLVRASGAWMFDERGRRYLDCVNNVNHVGHSHPRVAEAVGRQMRLLNTNTRYLHENLVRYVERLLALFPEPLDTCVLVNSGSEANDLALRMARAVTGRSGVIAVDGAYHGNLGGLIDISPYKFEGPGGRGRADHVRVVRLPDPYRGALRGEGRATGAGYAEDVRSAAGELGETGFGAAAFISEAILSCGGQVVPPAGYLLDAARYARAAGAVYIADEVQTGFGRVGSHWWAFELDGVVPDVVTLGKPIGNGHPIGAVITTRAIAEAFDPGMEYFNTFGGNPVSCAAGLAVLDVMMDDGLREHAFETGTHMRAQLEALRAEHPLIGDVRGRGLFVGVELVRDRETRDPAPDEASWLVNRARGHGVLLSTDGPDRNVIKIKPPLVFGRSETDRMVSVMNDVLGDDYLRRPPA